jgi:tetratricopeptide (TPR) repeat protein
MFRRLMMLTMVVAVALTAGCSKTEQAAATADDAYSAFRTAWDAADSSEAKAVLAEDYLNRFPDTDHSGTMAWRIAYYRGQDLGNPAGAWAAIGAALPQIRDPEQRFEASMAALSLGGATEIPLDLAAVADALAAVRPLTFEEQSEIVSTAIDLEEWAVADAHSLAALELATPEQYRLDYPDREYTDEQVATRANYRKASQLVMNGWALFNLGDPQGAFARFEEAKGVGSVGYLGVPNNPLYRYWGRAALAEGDYETAIDLLGAEAVFGEDRQAAAPFLREAYIAKNGDDNGYDEFLWTTRNRLAKTADDFELLDYQGSPHRLADAAGKVTLLAFWFPT